MSIEAMSWVLHHSPHRGTDKVVLLGIANHADPQGENAWPSITTLGVYARVGRSSVIRAIRNLEAAGAITVQRNAGGSRRTSADRRPNLYAVLMDERGVTGATPSAERGVTPATPRGVTGGTPGVSSALPRGVSPVTPEPSIEPSMEPSMEPFLPPTPPTPHLHGLTPTAAAETLRLLLWPHWPSGRKVGIPATRRALTAALRRGADPVEIVAGAERDGAVWATWPSRDRQFVPHPATWINDERWLSDPPEPRRGGSRRDQQVEDLSALAHDASQLPTLDELAGWAEPLDQPELPG